MGRDLPTRQSAPLIEMHLGSYSHYSPAGSRLIAQCLCLAADHSWLRLVALGLSRAHFAPSSCIGRMSRRRLNSHKPLSDAGLGCTQGGNLIRTSLAARGILPVGARHETRVPSALSSHSSGAVDSPSHSSCDTPACRSSRRRNPGPTSPM